MKKIGIMIAMDKEFDFFAKNLQNLHCETLHKRNFYRGVSGNKEISVVVSGMGKVNAALCTADLIKTFGAEIIINIGISGGLNSELKIGDFVVGDKIVYHDVWCGEPNKIGQVQDLPEFYYSSAKLCALLPEFRHGTLCCGDQFITDKKSLKLIIEKFPTAMAVDMESAAIAQTCYLYDIPMLSVRQISDVIGAEYQEEQYQNFWQNAPQHSIKVLQQLLEKI